MYPYLLQAVQIRDLDDKPYAGQTAFIPGLQSQDFIPLTRINSRQWQYHIRNIDGTWPKAANGSQHIRGAKETVIIAEQKFVEDFFSGIVKPYIVNIVDGVFRNTVPTGMTYYGRLLTEPGWAFDLYL